MKKSNAERVETFQVGRDGAAASLSSSGCLGDLFFYESLKLGVDS